MPQIRIALAQINSTVGALEANADLVVRTTAHAAGQHAHLVAFPEMALTGYPVEDLALRTSFVDASRAMIDALAARLDAEGLGSTAVVVGYVDRAEPTAPATVGVPKGSPQNAVAVLYGGRVVARQAKHHLPNYGVFDEFRYFVPGQHLGVFRLHGVDVALAICEDIWREGGPVSVARDAGAGLLLVINASPYEQKKDDTRLELAARRAREAEASLAYVTTVGGQDELVFDGDSLIVGADGELVARAPQFEDGCLIADLTLPQATAPAPEPWGVAREQIAGFEVLRTTLTTAALPQYPPEPGAIAPRLSDHAEMYAAIVTGLRDYVTKNGFTSVILGLSGGIDSALVAAVAVVVRELTAARPLVDLRRAPAVLRAADLPGAILLGAALGGIVLSFAAADTAERVIAPSGPWLLAGSAVAFAAFGWRQRRTSSPLVPAAAVRARPAWGALVVSVFVGAALVAVVVDVPVLARTVLPGADQFDAAVVLLRFLVALPVGALLGGWLVRRVSAALLTCVGMALATVGLAAMST